jgi:hypothetical protein
MIKFCKDIKDQLIELAETKRLYLEGNLLKVVEEDPEDKEFTEYLETANKLDKETRKKRLDITKQIQQRNNELTTAQNENNKLMDELQDALDESKKARLEAEKLRDAAVEDLDSLQKRTQFELIGKIVKSALMVIIGVGLITTGLYLFAMVNHYDTKILESSWSNMFGILLTNSFSIIGTIMGIKYTSEKINDKK